MAVQKINTAEKIIWTLFTVSLDAFCIFLGITVLFGPLGWVIKIFGKVSLSVYFFLKMGFNYLGGKRAGSKMAVTLISTMVDAIPELDDFIPSLTIELWSMYLILDKEAADEAKGRTQDPRLSRAA